MYTIRHGENPVKQWCPESGVLVVSKLPKVVFSSGHCIPMKPGWTLPGPVHAVAPSVHQQWVVVGYPGNGVWRSGRSVGATRGTGPGSGFHCFPTVFPLWPVRDPTVASLDPTVASLDPKITSFGLKITSFG